MSTPDREARRVVAIDVLRGLTMLLLLPDMRGAFSFYRVEQALPGQSPWRELAAIFTHADWVGATAWDMVMPVFVLLVGAAIPLSYRARVDRGEAKQAIIAHAVVRSAALVVLGLLMTMEVHDRIDTLMPYLLIFGIGLPVVPWLLQRAGADAGRWRLVLELAWGCLVIAVPLWWMGAHLDRLGGYRLGQIFILLGVAYLPAFAFVCASAKVQLAAAVAVLVAYGAAFFAYIPPPDLVPRGTAFEGLWSHWNNGTNLGTAVDRWLLDLLPHALPAEDEPHGYHLLHALAMVATLLAGMVCGRAMQDASDRRTLARRMTCGALLSIAVGVSLGITITPLVKSLWTPSWGFVATGVAVLLLAGVYQITDAATRQRSWRPLAVLGTNTVLLYVIAWQDRWRLLALWRDLPSALGVYAPIAESAAVLATIWVIAYMLERFGVRVRL